MLQYPCVHINLKKSKKFASEIFKHNRYGKIDMAEAPLIVGCANPNIQEKDNITPKTLSVDYAYIILPITNNMQGKKLMLSFQK